MLTERHSRSITVAADRAQTFVAIVAAVAMVVHFGRYSRAFSESAIIWVDAAIILCFVCTHLVKLIVARRRRAHIRGNLLDYILIVLVCVLLALAYVAERPAIREALSAWGVPSLRVLVLAVMRTYIVLATILRAVALHRILSQSRIRPGTTLVYSFLVIIIIGTSLLASPRAGAREPIGFVDALFTATSATCVTGLVVRNTGADFSGFGQGVILVLIQIGGLGLMTFTAFFAFVLGGGLSVKESVVMQDVLNAQIVGRISRLIVSILALTLVIEAIGAAAMFACWPDAALGVTDRVYYSVFHAISAFCNAGFSLYATSFEDFSSSAPFVLTLAILIILGGLGFGVLVNVLSLIRRKRGTSATVGEELNRLRTGARKRWRLTLHSKIVLLTSAVLIVAGMILFLCVETGPGMGDVSWSERILSAFFQSVTARTAGFNTVRIGGLAHPALFLLYVLMFIGASPASTGGGVKTSTFAINVFAIIAALRNRSNVEVFKRTIPAGIVRRAFLVLTMGIVVVTVSTFLLFVCEDAPFRDIAFEAMSAFGTVGLSAGITPSLSIPGKIIVAATMLVGRIGPLTLVVALSSRLVRAEAYEYPTERVTIG